MDLLHWLLDTVIGLYIWVILIGAILSWLIAFNVVNTRNRLVATIADVTDRLTEPALRPIRKILPTLGGVDLSPVVLLIALMFLQRLLDRFLPPYL
jgi:YggT family protein